MKMIVLFYVILLSYPNVREKCAMSGTINKKKMILYAEGDADFRSMFSNIIKDDGIYDIVAVEDGSQAIGWLADHVDDPPAMIVTGHTFLVRGTDLAIASKRAGIPVMIISSYAIEAKKILDEVHVKIPIISKPIDDVTAILTLIDKLTDTGRYAPIYKLAA